MIPVLGVLRILLFAGTALSIARLERNHQRRDRELAWAFGTACVLSVLTIAILDDDVASLNRATGAALVLGTFPLTARMFYPSGIDLLDPVAAAFVGFVVGSLSWGLAWQATVGAAAVAGLLAAIDLVKHDDAQKRIPFVSILLGIALVGTTGAALFS